MAEERDGDAVPKSPDIPSLVLRDFEPRLPGYLSRHAPHRGQGFIEARDTFPAESCFEGRVVRQALQDPMEVGVRR